MATQAVTGIWLGQDGHDVVGTTQNGPPNEVQDMHIAVSNLPSDRTVVKVDVLGYDGGQWVYNGRPGPSPAGWIQAPGATTADLYLDPYMVETGRTFFVSLVYDDTTSVVIHVQGGTADPNLRMPSALATVQWVGQDGQDLTGPGAGVGPDGIQDIRLALTNLSSRVGVASLNVRAASGAGWSFGTNPGSLSNAEFRKRMSDPTKADLYFNPIPGLSGQVLTLTVVYTDGKSDEMTVVAGSSDPGLRIPSQVPAVVTWGTIGAGWVGQDGFNPLALGDVHVAVSGLPAGRSVVSATLSDEARSNWGFQANPGSSGWVDPFARRLTFQRSTTDASRADIGFSPIRDETGSTMTLRVVLDDGSMHAVQFAGGAVNLGNRAPTASTNSIVARPGDNLVILINQYGSIHLSAGVYQVSQPLLLARPIIITADPGATILFSQAASDPVWTTAINVECGNTTLDGFSVRFAGPIRWATGTGSEPSVIGTPDLYGGAPRTPLVNIRLTHLDLMSPPAASSWESAAHLIWVTRAESGVIADNILKGGMTEFNNGPWLVTGNNYQGTVPNTFAYTAFAGHYTHDVLIANNTVQPVGSTGKSWRFLVMTGSGYRDVIRDNNVSGIGPMDNDTVAHPNAPEIVLTESYRLNYEGAVSSISTDGRVVQIPYLQGGVATTGDVISILSGPEAGQWRLIAQSLSPTTYLLNAPMSPGNLIISISTGFIQETFQGNTIDARGSSIAEGMILAGNHFDTKVLNNHFIGGNHGLRIAAAGSESPVMWGWSRAPILGATVRGNTFEDNLRGAVFEVEESIYTKRSENRTYMSLAFTDNAIVWSEAFLAARAQANLGLPTTFEAGNSRTTDPSGVVVTASGNTFKGPASLRSTASWKVYAATLNGQRVTNQSVALLPAVTLTAPTGLGLVRDTGASATDGVTNDSRLRFTTVTDATGYEYSLGNAPNSFKPVSSPTSFVPDGLTQGSNTVYVRAYDSSGNRGPIASVIMIYDSIAPGAVAHLIAFQDGRVQFEATGIDETHEYRLGGSGTYLFLGRTTQFSTADLLKGPRTVQVHSIDLAGNVGPDAITTIIPRWVSVEREEVVETTPPLSIPLQLQVSPETRTEPAQPGAVVKPSDVRPAGILAGPRRASGHRWFLLTRLTAQRRQASLWQSSGPKGTGAGNRLRFAPHLAEANHSPAGLRQRLHSLLQWKQSQRQR
ncbi:hypothetical protein V5E97_34165 [Singulisphaera sp. Ch08]|uniref:Right handed beta helix domain-containing protein n=1 Tax=Singulisphaera sp. Ch08 TaxID=3120278 RepID=A0AAU7CDZ4_9BACT